MCEDNIQSELAELAAELNLFKRNIHLESKGLFQIHVGHLTILIFILEFISNYVQLYSDLVQFNKNLL